MMRQFQKTIHIKIFSTNNVNLELLVKVIRFYITFLLSIFFFINSR